LKSTRYKKILGLAVGERSLFAAEVSAGARPQIRKLAELVYPPGISPQQPRELGQVLATFLRDQGVSAGAAIVGIPVKWLLVKCKEVPPVDGTTLSDMLRLQAESEFSSELKDLVFEYVQGPVGATQRKHLDWVSELCEAAKLKTVGVIPAALALGQSTVGVASEKETMVLAVGQGGSELTTQSGGQSSSIKHLRACEPRAPFVSELRRAVSTMPASAAGRELVMWDGTDLDAHALSEQLGLSVRRGDLPSLGVDGGFQRSGAQIRFRGGGGAVGIGRTFRRRFSALSSGPAEGTARAALGGAGRGRGDHHHRRRNLCLSRLAGSADRGGEAASAFGRDEI
jgi:hypothetical protein